MKKFVLLRGSGSRGSGLLYLHDRETYEFMEANKTLKDGYIDLEFVTDSDDRALLEMYQRLVNDDLLKKD